MGTISFKCTHLVRIYVRVTLGERSRDNGSNPVMMTVMKELE